MTQEEKELLLKDLSARLPYGVIVRHSDPLIDNDGNDNVDDIVKWIEL